MTDDDKLATDGTQRRKWRRLGLAFAIVFPTAVTWLYFVWASNQPPHVGQTTYAIGKIIQFGMPVVWTAFVLRERVTFPQWCRSGLGLSVLLGIVIAGASLALYFSWLAATPEFANVRVIVAEKLKSLGLNSAAAFIAVGLFYSLIHSGMEEYYWRWFVFRQLRIDQSMAVATLISSFGFMAHHVIVLSKYFGSSSPLTWLFSLAVAVGGMIWAVLYQRTNSIIGPWVCHCLVDAAIFTIGFDLARHVW